MSIYKVNKNLSRQDQIDLLNSMILELEGLIYQGKFDKNELDDIHEKLCARKFLRNIGLGNTTSTYTNWSHLQEETGYSIWKYTPSDYLYNSLNQLYFGEKETGEDTTYKLLNNKGEADSESATTFDYVFLYNGDSGAGYTDNTTEAGTAGGTEFSVMNSSNDYLYVGEGSTFAGTKFEWETRGGNYTLVVEYWNGSAWTTMTANANELDDDTSNFESDGRVTWSIPSDWATTAVNGQTKYWIRFSTSSTPTTTAEAYYIIPGNNVISLLALSSDEISKEEWAWCSYDGSIYATIRNTGNTSYEGEYYITSASSASNLQNFFIYNHEYLLDHEDSTYSEVTPAASDLTLTTSHSVILVDASVNDVTITLPVASENEGKRLTIKVTAMASGTDGVHIDAQSGETVDGEAGKTLKYENEFVTLISDGSDWWIIGDKSTE